MARAGVLKPDERVELIEGRIVDMSPIGPWHTHRHSKLDRAIQRLYPEPTIIATQGALHLDEDMELQPDLLVLRPDADEYEDRVPTPADVILLVEVADTSREYDLTTKVDLYAAHGVPEYWVVDKELNAIHVFRRPQDRAFNEHRIHRKGESIALPECADQSMAVDVVL
jgi:Uma2 family endonuclease